MIIYTVKKGDTLWNLANTYGVTVQQLRASNGLSENDRLSVGQALVIPTATAAHLIHRGDSLYSIALQHGVSVDELLRLNPKLKPPYTIYPDRYLNVPAREKTRTIEVNGYCYPSITDETLGRILPNLTYISIFSYRLSPDGSLSGTDDSRIITAARNANVAPLMTVTNTKSSGGFDSDAAKAFFENTTAQQMFINGIPEYLKAHGYLGLNVDLEYIYAENREDYVNFMRALGDRLSAEGLLLTAALAPKIGAMQKGRLYEGHDYNALGSICDWVMLMTYEWGYIAGPPMAVAPLREVERVVRYATSETDPQSIMLGMPNYAYDWKLPFTPGTRAKLLTLSDAVQTAARVGSAIEYNSASDAPFFTYREGGKEHIVWFDDARSFAARLSLVEEYGLRGIGVWTVNTYYPPFWETLNSMYNIKKLL